VLALVVFGQGLLPGHLPTSADYLWQSTPWRGSLPAGVSQLGSNFELSDSITQFQPFLLHSRRTLPHLPLWDPYVMGGRPFLANGQSGVFSPFNLPAYLLPFWHSLAVIEILKVLAAALGTFAFGRSLGMRFWGALVAGTVFGFSQAMVDWVTWPHTSTWALLPWLLLLVDRLVDRPRLPIASGLAAVVALAIFGGHPETTFDVIGAAVAWFVFRAIQRRADGRARARLGTFAFALVAGVGLAAIVVIPFLELLHSSWDYDNRRGSFGEHALGSQYLRAFFMPDWWGRPTQAPVTPFAVLPVYGHAFYAGALSLLLAAAAVLRRPRAERVVFAVVGLGAALALAGVEPVTTLVSFFRGPTKIDKLFFYAAFCVAMLAGFGLDDLAEGARGRSRAVLTAAVAIFAFPVVWALADGVVSFDHLGAGIGRAFGSGAASLAHPASASEIADIRVGALVSWLVFGGVGLALVWARVTERLRSSSFVLAAVVLIAVDLLRVDVGFNPAIATPAAVQPTTPALSYLTAHRPSRFAGVNGTNLLGLPPLAPNVAISYRLYDARGYDFPVDRRFARLWSENVAPVPPEPRFSFPEPTPRALRALGLLSVSSIVTDAGSDHPGLRPAYDGADATIYSNPYALPRAFVVGAQRVVAQEAALRAVTDPGFDAGRAAVTERAIAGLPTTEAAGFVGRARFTSYEPERVELAASASQPGLLVVTDTYSPGWRAEVDGRDVPLHRVDYLLRGVPLPPGHHRVVLTYSPASVRVGLLVSIVTALVLVLAATWRRFRLGVPWATRTSQAPPS
jgi:hypothetical protein